MWILCLSLLVLLVLAKQIVAESDSTDPNKPQDTDKQVERTEHLQDLIQQLRQQRTDYYVQKAKHDAQMQKAHQNCTILKDEVDDLRRQEAELDEQLQKYRSEVEEIEKDLILKTSLQNVVKQQIQPFISSQRKTIENGIPYKQQERITRLEAACNDCNAPNLVSMADQLGHIWNYAQEELRLARSPETYTERALTGEGYFPYARYFRVGQLILGYVTEDGQQTAIWSSLPNKKD